MADSSKLGRKCMAPFGQLSSLRPYQVSAGVVAREVRGETLGAALVEIESGFRSSESRHAFEQLGFIVRGEVKMTIGDEVRTMRPGDTYVIPPGTIHSTESGPEGATLIEVSPPRLDWTARARLKPAQLNWP